MKFKSNLQKHMRHSNRIFNDTSALWLFYI